MNFSEMNDEHKVQINLSASAWQIIEQDISIFYTEAITNISGPLNHIFSNYYEKSSLNISETIEKELQALRRLLKAGKLSNDSETVICQKLITEKMEALKIKYLSVPKGIGKKIRISDSNFALLSSLPDDSYECQLFAPSTGKFLSAIFEEYATLPQHEREAIALADRMNLLHYALETHSMLKLTVQDEVTKSNITYLVQPCAILPDNAKRYNYLATYTRPMGTDTEFYMASYRIANIKEIKRTTERFHLSKNAINALKKGIQEKGVPFLVGELETYEIVFSNEGLELFRRLLNLRPTILAYNKNRFTLRSTKYQKDLYFKQFRSDMYEELRV